MTDDPIISTKDRPGDYDAIETAKPGEPIFTLQGGDPFAPATVQKWADLARAAGLKADDEKLLAKASNAEKVGWAMQDYQKAGGEAVVSEPEDVAPAIVITERNATLARAADRVYNSIAEMAEIEPLLRELDEAGHSSVPAAHVSLALTHLRKAVAEFEPRRHMRDEA